MKSFLLFAAACLLSSSATAHNQEDVFIQGTVFDSATNKPLGLVTVALLNSKTHETVKSGLTNDDGSFGLKVPADNAYEAIFASVGYKNKIIAVSIADVNVNVGKVLLSAVSSELQEVSI